MGVGDILDAAIRLYRQEFRTLVGVAALYTVPALLLDLAARAIYRWLIAAGARSMALSFGSTSEFLLQAIQLVLYTLSDAALVYCASQRYLGQPAAIRSAYQAAWRRLWRLLLAPLGQTFLLALLAVTVLGIPFACYLLVKWAFLTQAIMVEGTAVRQSFRRSSALVQGHWWRVLGLTILVIIPYYLISPVGTLRAFVPQGVREIVDPNTRDALAPIGMAIQSILEIVARPLSPLAGTLLYYDLRIRKEGFDLQVAAERLVRELPPGAAIPSARGRRPALPSIRARLRPLRARKMWLPLHHAPSPKRRWRRP